MTDFWTYWRVRAKRRKKQITRNIKGLKNYETLLYIGANKNRLEMIDLFYGWNYKIDVLEAWESNVKGLEELNAQYGIFRNIIHADIMNNGIEGMLDSYGVVMFWHGPEHVERKKLPKLIKKLESLAAHYVIMAAPIGRYVQKEVDGNPYERHRSYLNVKDFKKFGYKVDCIRKDKPRGSNMVAWKEMS